MNFLNRIKFPVITGFLLFVVLTSCEDDLTSIGAEVIGGEPFITDNVEFEVFAYNKKIEAVRTNRLSIYQLGIFNDPVYGSTRASITSQLLLEASSPNFGIYSQEIEDNSENDDIISTIQENETVTDVILYIPYLTNSQADTDGDGLINELDADPEDSNSDTDGDGVSDNQERINGTDPLIADSVDDAGFVANNFAKKVDLDSIYVNNELYENDSDIAVSFNLKVERSTYFLRDLDPSTNFQEAQEYYSTQQFSPAFVSDNLFDGVVTISNEQILVEQDDVASTEDVDESGTFERIEPGIRVSLDTAFFQENIIDKEGDSELLSQSNFNDFMRGIHLSTTSISDNVMMLLDMSKAKLTIEYNYDSVDQNETTDDTSDDVIVQKKSEFVFSILNKDQNGNIIGGGNAINTFNNDAYPTSISTALDTGDNASRIYVKGGAGTYTEIKLFAEDVEESMDFINEIKSKNWIINEANLVFYVDRNTIDNVGGVIEPPRLYLHNVENNAPLINFSTENSNNVLPTLFNLYLNYDGIIEKTSDNKGEKYTVRITDHINNIIVRDSANAVLGLTITPDIGEFGVDNAMLVDGGRDIPIAPTLSPLGTVLYGGIPENGDKRLKLEIFYTETN